MSLSKARTVAFDTLLRVAKQDAYADEVLRAELDASVKTEDAGLATELAMGVLRWQRLLDFFIDRNLKKPATVADVEVRIALRLGAYQLLFLNRIPAHAAIFESVELVKRARKRSASTLVNAVLRKLAKEPLSAKPSETSYGKSPVEVVAHALAPYVDPAERLGIQYSHPTWMVERWLRIYGEDRTRELLQTNNRVPSVAGYLLDSRRDADARLSLQRGGASVRPGRLVRDAWTFDSGNLAGCEAVSKGWVAIQDEASQAVARLLGTEPGDTVLDLCAAPGGKTLLLAQAAGASGRVIAADLHENRVRGMRERLELAGIQNVETIVLNASQPLPVERPFDRPFDRILVDVPCSGTGTLARHPEIRWKLQLEDLGDLHERQARLLRNALPLLAAGGRLVYSTCSLEAEENELVVREVLAAFGEEFKRIDARPALINILQPSVPEASVVGADGFFRTFPPERATDGFFAAILARANSNV